MKKKPKKNSTNVSLAEKEKNKQYTIEELLKLGSKTNKIEIAPDISKKDKLSNKKN